MIITNDIKNNLKQYFRSPYNIKEVIDYIDNIDSIYKYSLNNIDIIVYYREGIDNIDKKLIIKTIKRGCVIYKKEKKIIINLIYTPAKKILEYNKPLTTKNVNSGFTFANGNEIFIFRREEFPKVIIHELIHHNRYIHNDNFKLQNKLNLIKHFNLHPNTTLILNEAIVELWATFIHLSFVSRDYKIDLKELLNVELHYSLYKTWQIFELQKKFINNLWYDECNIFSYIIFKTICIFHLHEFIKIYSFPYDDTMVSNFIISHSKIKIINHNPSYILNGVKYQRSDNSLCFMLLSDL
jgi:hypothetical protein